MTSNIVLALTTSYNTFREPEAVRFNLCMMTLLKAREKGYSTVVIDSNSTTDTAVTQLKSAATYYEKEREPSFGVARRQSIEAALKISDTVVMMEPEKASFVDLIDGLVEILKNERPDILVPKRKSFESYPTIQQYSEQALNTYWEHLTHASLDISFGPRIFMKEGAQIFLDYRGERGDAWESIFIPLMIALRDGKKIISGEVDYTHPESQRALEEKSLEFDIKRIHQLSSLTAAMRSCW
jgi:hypothetical protein